MSTTAGRLSGAPAVARRPRHRFAHTHRGDRSTSLGMAAGHAQMIAERAHRGWVEPSGRPYIEHVRRVAARVPDGAVSVAWLHDVLEWTELTDDDPALAALAPGERHALRLLTRHGGDDDRAFLHHLRTITAAPGTAGDIARAVKRADMQDRLRHPRDPEAPWRPPYLRALELVASDSDRHIEKGGSPT